MMKMISGVLALAAIIGDLVVNYLQIWREVKVIDMAAISAFVAKWGLLLMAIVAGVVYLREVIKSSKAKLQRKADEKALELDKRLELFGKQKNVILDAINRLANKIPDGSVIVEELKIDLTDLDKEGTK